MHPRNVSGGCFWRCGGGQLGVPLRLLDCFRLVRALAGAGLAEEWGAERGGDGAVELSLSLVGRWWALSRPWVAADMAMASAIGLDDLEDYL